jgi:hypothetical protein
MVDRFGISGTAFPPQHKPQSQYHGFETTYVDIPSFEKEFLTPAEDELATLQPSQSPIYRTTWLENRTLAVTTQINEELGKCNKSASKSNTRRRRYGNKQCHMLQYCSFWFS